MKLNEKNAAKREKGRGVTLLCLLTLALCFLLCGCRFQLVRTVTDGPETLPQAETPDEPPVESASLWEMGYDAVSLYLDGTEYSGLRLGETVWVDCRNLAEGLPGLAFAGEGESLTLTDRDGHRAEIPCLSLHKGEALQETAGAVLVRNGDESPAEYWVSLGTLVSDLFFRSLHDGENDVYYLSPAVDTSLIPRGRAVPVLMYHAVSDEYWGLSGLFLEPASLDEQLSYLTENGYDLLFFSDLTHLDEYDKPVLLTFDDGYNDNYDQLYPILEKYNAKATIFMITHNMDYNPNFMTSDQVRTLSHSGLVDIQSHTVYHKELGSMSTGEQDAEMRGSQLALARVTGKIPYVLSYPAGSHDENTLLLGPEYYDFAVQSRGNLWTVSDSFFEIERYPIYRGAGAGSLRSILE